MGFFDPITSIFESVGILNTPEKAKVKSVEERFADLRKAGAFGYEEPQSVQDTNLGLANQGFSQLSDLGTSLQQNKDSSVQLSNEVLDKNERAIASQAQLAPVDYASSLRTATDVVDTQRAQAASDQALLAANERQQNVGQLASVGSQIANANTSAFNTNLFAQAGLEASRTANESQMAANQAAFNTKQQAAILGGLTTAGTTAYNAFKNKPVAPLSQPTVPSNEVSSWTTQDSNLLDS